MVERILGYSNKEMLHYCNMLLAAQERYMNGEFVCRKKITEKRSKQRNSHYQHLRLEDDAVRKKIKDSIDHYNKTDE